MVLLALMQANSTVLDVEHNCRAVDEAAQKAAAAGARVLLTPELFPVGYAPLRVRTELDPAGLPLRRYPWRHRPAPRHRDRLQPSCVIAAAGNGRSRRPWSSTGVELLSYSKVHLFGPEERKAFAPRSSPRRRGFRRDQDVTGDLLRRRISRDRPCRGRPRRRPAPGSHRACPTDSTRFPRSSSACPCAGKPTDGGLRQPLGHGRWLRIPRRKRDCRSGRLPAGRGRVRPELLFPADVSPLPEAAPDAGKGACRTWPNLPSARPTARGKRTWMWRPGLITSGTGRPRRRQAGNARPVYCRAIHSSARACAWLRSRPQQFRHGVDLRPDAVAVQSRAPWPWHPSFRFRPATSAGRRAARPGVRAPWLSRAPAAGPPAWCRLPRPAGRPPSTRRLHPRALSGVP